jgi:NADP-dependent 3-hydroxy acid dehydrogenase YdfG
MKRSRAVLITGCSSGIGRTTAIRLHRAGFPVYATARNVDTIEDLTREGVSTMPLDVTDEASMTAAMNRIEADHGAVGSLVNNAGFELAGTVEETTFTEVLRQFHTNVLGLIRLSQLVLPGMRAQGYGRIVNLSSVFGRFAVPGNAFYAASKHAVAGFTDGLRREMSAFGVYAALIEPTAARTRLEANAAWGTHQVGGPYADLRGRMSAWHAQTYQGPPHNVAGRMALDADDVARVIQRAITSRKPRGRYPVGVLAHGLFLAQRALPGRLFDAFVRSQFPRA